MQRSTEGLIFSTRQGRYIPNDPNHIGEILAEQSILGQGGFPYNFERKYEACESFNIFDGKQRIINQETFPGSQYLKYTMGFEFETSAGYIPEEIVFRDGIIPLRDGSISGLEYSSVVLTPDDSGLSLLHQQLKTLRKYTSFNKECALHIHFGNFPMEKKAIFNLYLLCYYLQGNSLKKLVPRYTFDTQRYKKHHEKNYCGFIPSYSNFEDLFYDLTSMDFKGSFTEPHPADPDRHHKWNIGKRYYWINFMNLLCYDVNKTVEFRFLRPTYNLKKILVWVYIFNAMMLYAEKMAETNGTVSRDINFMEILKAVYPEDFAKKIYFEGVTNLFILTQNQTASEDFCGSMVEEERKLFDEDELI